MTTDRPNLSTVINDTRKERPNLQETYTMKSLRYSEAKIETTDILDFWNTQPHLTTHRRNSKCVRLALYYIENYILPYNKPAEIKQAIQDADQIVSNHISYSKYPQKNISIHDFFTNITAKFRNSDQTESWFKLLLNEGHVNYLRSKDQNSEVTEHLKKLYFKHSTGQPVKLSAKELSQLHQTSERIVEFSKSGRLKKHLNGAGWKDHCLHLFICLTMHYDKDSANITPGHLCSNYTWNNLFPRYITREFE